MKKIIMAFGALAIAGAVPALAQNATTPPPAPPAPDAAMAPPAAPTPPAADGSMAPAQPGTMQPGTMSNGSMSSGNMQSSGMQSAMPAPTTGPLPKCSAKVKDRCDQSATSERYALSADQAMKTGGVGDRRSDNAAMGKSMSGGHMMHHKMMHGKMMHHKMMHEKAAVPAA